MNNKDYFTKEIYKKMYEHKEKIVNGLMDMTEKMIAADKKIIINVSAEKNTNADRLTVIDTDRNVLFDDIISARLVGEIDRILLSANTIIAYNFGEVINCLKKHGCIWRTDYDDIDLSCIYTEIYAQDGIRHSLDECAVFLKYESSRAASEETEACLKALYCYEIMEKTGVINLFYLS